jgi:hypothetical protein
MLTPSEKVIKEEYEKEGWTVFKPSWPNFIMVKNGEVQLVEAKLVSNRLSKSQRESFELLQRLGMRIEIAYLRSTTSRTTTKRVFDKQNGTMIGTKKQGRKPQLLDLLSTIKARAKAKIEVPTPVPDYFKSDAEGSTEVKRIEKDTETEEILNMLPKVSPTPEGEEGST